MRVLLVPGENASTVHFHQDQREVCAFSLSSENAVELANKVTGPGAKV